MTGRGSDEMWACARSLARAIGEGSPRLAMVAGSHKKEIMMKVAAGKYLRTNVVGFMGR